MISTSPPDTQPLLADDAGAVMLFPPVPPGITSSVAREVLWALATPLEWVQSSVRPWLTEIPRRSRNGVVRTRVELAVDALRR